MTEINCAEACINGCVLGDNCPNLEYKEKAAQFIQDTHLDKVRGMADMAVGNRTQEGASQPPKWVLPED